MIRSELSSLLTTLGLSVFLHAGAFIVWGPLFGCGVVSPPELIPSQPGVASVKLVPSEDAQPEPSEQPKVEEPTLPSPKPPEESALPEMLPDVKPAPLPLAQMPKLDPIKPVVDAPKKVQLPKMEATVKPAQTKSKQTPASQEMQGSVDQLPTMAINPPPVYPADAIAARQEGTVTLRVAISAEGRVTAISLYASSDVQSLDDSALTTVRRWIFTPARRAGRPVPFEVLVPIEFSIRRQ